jgi:calcineurin-like phosphoesterase family protein
MTTWFTSDLHFGHKNIIKYCARPFRDTKEMDAALIEAWNAVVAPEDEVWNLGDVGFCCSPEHLGRCLAQLNGTQFVIRGNHDETLNKLLCDEEVAVNVRVLVKELTEVEYAGQSIVLCHYALREWHHALRGVWHLFGHTHAALPPYGKSMDVGVDNAYKILGAYRPFSFAEVKGIMDTLPIGPHPEFAGFTPSSKEVTA